MTPSNWNITRPHGLKYPIWAGLIDGGEKDLNLCCGGPPPLVRDPNIVIPSVLFTLHDAIILDGLKDGLHFFSLRFKQLQSQFRRNHNGPKPIPEQCSEYGSQRPEGNC